MRRSWVGLGVGLALVCGISIVGILGARDALLAPYKGFAGPHLDFTLDRGMSAASVAQKLEGLGVLSNGRAFRWWLWWSGDAGKVKAGEYRIAEPLSAVQVARIVTQGRVLQHPVTLVEGATRWQVAEAMSSAGFGTTQAALKATTHIELIADLDPDATTLEGYLFPETYLAPRGTAPLQLVEMAVERFRNAWTAARRQRAAAVGLSLHQVVTLASLIEAETREPSERAVVAAVFHNRLARGMLLQTDPTVLYAMRLAGRQERKIRQSDLRRQSPYNTYTTPGLPQGPIGNPRAASIDAALHPAGVDFLYFVSRNDGTHAFSRTLQAHNRLVKRYQR